MIRELTESEIWELARSVSFAHLGCSADGRLYVVPVSFTVDGGRILGMTTAGMKIEMMRKNPDVCVQVEAVESLTSWQSGILWGRFEELEGQERAEAARLLLDKYGALYENLGQATLRGRVAAPPRLDNQAAPMIAYAITITEVSGRRESN